MKALIKDSIVVDVVEKEFPVHNNCVAENWHLIDKGEE